jgi:ribonuclease Z
MIESGLLDPRRRTPAVYAMVEGTAHLFDCGAAEYAPGFVGRIANIFVSHLHMDHWSHFDAILGLKIQFRPARFSVYGPAGITAAVQAKIRAYTWNLLRPRDIVIDVGEIEGSRVARRQISIPDDIDGTPGPETSVVWEDDLCRVRCVELNHKIVSLGYAFEEKDRYSIVKEELASSGWTPGPWLEELKSRALLGEERPIRVQDQEVPLERLRRLLTLKRGARIVYLTDFILEPGTIEKIRPIAQGADALYCESNYAEAEAELAREHHHLTARQAAEIARDCEVKELRLFHFSARYEDREPLFHEARAVFERTV